MLDKLISYYIILLIIICVVVILGAILCMNPTKDKYSTWIVMKGRFMFGLIILGEISCCYNLINTINKPDYMYLFMVSISNFLLYYIAFFLIFPVFKKKFISLSTNK